MMCKFWWQSSPNTGMGIHWMSWERLCNIKSDERIEFRKLHDFNMALLGKQAWRLLTQPSTLASKIYKARYYPKSSFLMQNQEASKLHRHSSLEARYLIKRGAACRIGDGRSVNVLKDS